MAYDIEQWTANDLARRPRRRHWAWVILAAMAVPVIQLAMLLARESPGDGRTYTTLLPVIIAVLLSPFARDWWFTQRRLAMFDEFERAALNDATEHAYGMLMALLAVLFLWLAFGVRLGLTVPTQPRHWEAIGITLIGIGGALPIFFAELMVPMPPTGEAEDVS